AGVGLELGAGILVGVAAGSCVELSDAGDVRIARGIAGGTSDDGDGESLLQVAQAHARRAGVDRAVASGRRGRAGGERPERVGGVTVAVGRELGGGTIRYEFLAV